MKKLLLIYTGGIRQDISNEKIYKINLSNVEQDISVNQHLVVNDTFSTAGFDTLIISSIDSVLIGTKYHKQYHYKSFGTYADSGAYVVGVGEVWRYGFEGTSNLGCFSVNNTNLYGSAPFCQITSVNELFINKNKISISPNPFCSQTVLQTDNPLHNAILTADNCFGQTVAQIKNINGQTVVFSRNNLASGLYFVRLTQDSKVIAVGKLVITDK